MKITGFQRHLMLPFSINFDVMLISTHAPGMSAYNQVERRMAPLSRALAGLILPHESCGTNLNSRQRIINIELEKRNFKMAGDILASIWEELVIDKFPIVAEYITNEAITSVMYDEK